MFDSIFGQFFTFQEKNYSIKIKGRYGKISQKCSKIKNIISTNTRLIINVLLKSYLTYKHAIFEHNAGTIRESDKLCSKNVRLATGSF